ncbi:MAG: hypothetical protein N2Z70_00720 [Bdellovibrionaceae bacterium]|nr:hypothetical protein [Pseudobdellovibrionaceae bacterium]
MTRSLFIIYSLALVSLQSTAQTNMGSRVNLEDVNIQGEAGKKGGLLQNRNRFELNNRIKPKTHFQKELKAELARQQQSSYQPLKR